MLPMERERGVNKSVCQMVSLVALQIIYLLCGSAIFMNLERKHAQDGYNQTLTALIELRKELSLTPYQESVLKDAFGRGFSFSDTQLHEKAAHAWDYISTLYFSITSTTTIGYGHQSPSTDAGQLFCILFSLFGIPLHMVTLGAIGRHLNTVISRFLNWSVGSKLEGKKDVATFGVTCVLLTLFTGLSTGSVRLVIQDMSLVEAIYFIYVTISTIGFGDFVLRFEEHKAHNRLLILLLWAVSVYIGMAILSATVMSISTRNKQWYTWVFHQWNKRVLGENFRRPTMGRRTNHTKAHHEGLIEVDKAFLIAQLDLQTDPDKRAEIQRWIDMYEMSSDEYSPTSSDYEDDDGYYKAEKEDLENVN